MPRAARPAIVATAVRGTAARGAAPWRAVRAARAGGRCGAPAGRRELAAARRRATQSSAWARSFSRRFAVRARRVAQSSTLRDQAAQSGTTSSAAPEGVGARRSAAKSAIVKSVSWPTAGHHRDRARTDRAGQRLVVEGPQILERAAAARQDQDVAFVATCGRRQRCDKFRRRRRALHGRRVDHDGCGRESPPQHREDVAYRGPGRRSDDANAAGQPRQAVASVRHRRGLPRPASSSAGRTHA